MKTRFISLLPLLILSAPLLGACTAPRLPAWKHEPVSAQFSALVLPQAPDLPLQGGLRLGPGGGRFALITQHGRTLGDCTLREQQGEIALACRAAPGMRTASGLLARVARAACLVLAASTAPPNAAQGKGWTVRQKSPEAVHSFLYEDSLGQVNISITEVHRP